MNFGWSQARNSTCFQYLCYPPNSSSVKRKLTCTYFLFSLSEKQLTVYRKTLYCSLKKTKQNQKCEGFVGHLSTSFASLTVNSPVIQCIISSASRRAFGKEFLLQHPCVGRVASSIHNDRALTTRCLKSSMLHWTRRREAGWTYRRRKVSSEM